MNTNLINQDYIDNLIKEETNKKIQSLIEELKIEDLQNTIVNQVSSHLTKKNIHNIDITTFVNAKKMTGKTHKDFEMILKLVSTKIPLMLFGNAGSGKSHIAKQVTEALDIDFYSMSLNDQTSKTDILGYNDLQNCYQETVFYKSFKNGGLILLDELDSCNSNILTILNSALSNEFCFFGSENVKKNDNFYCIATANTDGQTPNRKYQARNILDFSTLDRFYKVNFEIDNDLENSLLASEYLIGFKNKFRQDLNDNYEISTRLLLRIDNLLVNDFDFFDSFKMSYGQLDDRLTDFVKDYTKNNPIIKAKKIDSMIFEYIINDENLKITLIEDDPTNFENAKSIITADIINIGKMTKEHKKALEFIKKYGN
jgi:AAA domain (dynein-related subfamily)